MEQFEAFDINNVDLIKNYLHLDVVHDKKNWPDCIVEMSDFIMAELRCSGLNGFEERFVNSVLILFSMEYGSTSIYLPSKDRIKSFLSDSYPDTNKVSILHKSRGKGNNWTNEVVSIISVLNNTLNNLCPEVIEDNRWLLIEKFLEAFSFACGGRSVYISNCMSIKSAVRNELVFKQFNGMNHKQLSRAYKLSVQTIYEIVRTKRKANLKLVGESLNQ